MCEELIHMLAMYTITDDACIACADNGEVFVTEKELYEVLNVIGRMVRITDEAPCESASIICDPRPSTTRLPTGPLPVTGSRP